LSDGLLFVFSLCEGNGKAERAVDAGDVAAVAVGGFEEVFVLFEVDGFVGEKLGPVLEWGEVLEVE